MGLEGSKESVEYSSHHSTSPLEGIDVATFEAEAQKMREISRMDQVVRSRFQQGVRYNMKVLLCGHKKTGKTLLWKRFQGMPFTESYEPTPEIQSATINWTSPSSSSSATHAHSNHGSTGDTVKVEVWDVVDKAIRTARNSANRFSTADLVYTLKGDVTVPEGKHALRLLDATAVDVYQGAHAAVFLINPFDRQSLLYVQEKYPTVPGHVSILLVLNSRDKVPSASSAAQEKSPNHHDNSSAGAAAAGVQVTIEDVRELCAQIQSYRSNLATDDVTVIETSLKNGFGLLHLHHYLDVPFLRLKQRSLQEQLAHVERDLLATHANIADTVRAAHYDDYVRHLAARSREKSGQSTSPESAVHTGHRDNSSEQPTASAVPEKESGQAAPFTAPVERTEVYSRSSSLQAQASSSTTPGALEDTDTPTSSGGETTARASVSPAATPAEAEVDGDSTAPAASLGAAGLEEVLESAGSSAGGEAEQAEELDEAYPAQQDSSSPEVSTGTKASRAPTSSTSAHRGSNGTARQASRPSKLVGEESSSSEEDVGMAQKVGFGRKPLSSVRDKRKPALRKATRRSEREGGDAEEDQPPVASTAQDEQRSTQSQDL